MSDNTVDDDIVDDDIVEVDRQALALVVEQAEERYEEQLERNDGPSEELDDVGDALATVQQELGGG